MKQFFKVFIFSLIIFSLVASAGIFTYLKYLSPEEIAEAAPSDNDIDEEETDDEFKTPLERAIRESNKINVLLVGLEGSRSDTIMLASYDRKTKKASLISIPRDTYYYREEYAKYDELQKINAIYGTEDDGIKALVEAVEDLTGIPIDNYATIKYSGLRAAVDALGGVEFDVPFHMRYTDPYDELDINVPAGNQIIYGDDAMELLRFRKTNYPGYQGYPNGDLGRVQTQQAFMKAAAKKAMSLKLASVISAVYPHIKTDFTLTEMLGLVKDAIGFSADNMETMTLPGTDKMMGKLSFYLADGEKIIQEVYKLYDINLSATNDDENATELN